MQSVPPRVGLMLHRRFLFRASLPSSSVSSRRFCVTHSTPPPPPPPASSASSVPLSATARVEMTARARCSGQETGEVLRPVRASPASVEAAVATLREAIEAWSAVEKQKLNRPRTPSSRTGSATAVTSTTTPTTPKSTPLATGPASTETRASTDTTTSPHPTTTTTTTTTTATSSSASDAAEKDADFSVRNKQDRFWEEYVYTPSEDPTSATKAAPSTLADSTPSAADSPSPPSQTASATLPTASTPAVPSLPAKVTFSSVRQSNSLGRSRPSLQPFRSRTKRQVAISVADLVNRDPQMGPELVSSLSAESRRLMVVMGTASEYFGGEYGDVVEQVKMADRDRDRLISSEDYDVWASRSFQGRPDARVVIALPENDNSTRGSPTNSSPGPAASAPPVSATAAVSPLPPPSTSTKAVPRSGPTTGGGQHGNVVRAIQRHPDTAAGTTAPSASSSSSTTSTSSTSSTSLSTTSSSSTGVAEPHRPTRQEDPSYINWSIWWKLVLAAAPPFFAFGLLDNMTFVLSGDAIDRTMSQAFQLSEMTAAALGGVVSGVAGIQVHGLAEKYTRMTPPPLTTAQKRSPSYNRADRAGNSLGMVFGLIAGMIPLLWLHKHSEDEQNEDIEHDIALMKEEAMQSAVRRVQREAKLRNLLEEHQRAEWDDLMKQAKADRLKVQRSQRKPDKIDDRHNPH